MASLSASRVGIYLLGSALLATAVFAGPFDHYASCGSCVVRSPPTVAPRVRPARSNDDVFCGRLASLVLRLQVAASQAARWGCGADRTSAADEVVGRRAAHPCEAAGTGRRLRAASSRCARDTILDLI